MDNFEYNSPISELQQSTESVLISEYTTTLIQVIDEVSESSTNVLDGMYVFYGMNGILIFFVIYMICYSYLIHMKEKEEEREIELRRLNERALHTYRNPPMDEGRIFVEDFHGISVNPSRILPRQLAGACHAIAREHPDGAQRENEESRTIEEMNTSFRSPQQIVDRKFFPEDFQDLLCPNTTTPEQAKERYRAALLRPDSHDKMFGWTSTPPLCFSSPRESKERISYPEDFRDLCPNTTQIEKCGSLKDQKSQEHATATPSKSNVGQSSYPEGQSRSSPTSPDVVRRRLTTIEGTPRRPSSWR